MQTEATADPREFAFVADMPASSKGTIRKGIDAFRAVVQEFETTVARHGAILPIATVAEHLGVTIQAVQNYVARGQLEAVEISGRRFIVAASVLARMAKGPGKPGRPRKVTALETGIAIGRELAAAAEGRME